MDTLQPLHAPTAQLLHGEGCLLLPDEPHVIVLSSSISTVRHIH